MELLHRYQGCIVGLAVGDALGHPAEFKSPAQIRTKYGPAGITDFEPAGSHPPGTYTDDTQMSLAVARALIGADDSASLYAAMGKEFVAWSKSPENNRSPGMTCMQGCARLAGGISPLEAGIVESKGCGSAMRAAPVALRYHGNIERIVEAAGNQSRLTHRHPTAIAASIAVAVTTELALCNTSFGGIAWEEAGKRVVPEEWFLELLTATNGISEEFTAKLLQVAAVLDLLPEAAYPLLGEGWVGEEAFAGAFYAFLRSPRDYRQIVLTAANAGGDADSIACIAGAFSGAFNGLHAIPEEWRRQVENAADLLETGTRLYQSNREGGGEPLESSKE